MYFNIETITPERAKELLLNSRRNRRLNTGRVTTYANDIRNGKWTQSPEPICLDEEGELTNGQHRLNAVILAGIPIQCAVAYNVPIDAVVDKGLERASGDALYMRGLVSKEMSSAKVIAIVNRYLTMLGRERVSDTDMETYLACYRDATFVCSVCGDTVYPKVSVNEQGIFINSVRNELRGGLANKSLKKNVCNRCVSASKELAK